MCESDSAYLRMLPSPSPARGVKEFSLANLEDTDDYLYSLLGVERQGADHKRRLLRPVLGSVPQAKTFAKTFAPPQGCQP